PPSPSSTGKATSYVPVCVATKLKSAPLPAATTAPDTSWTCQVSVDVYQSAGSVKVPWKASGSPGTALVGPSIRRSEGATFVTQTLTASLALAPSSSVTVSVATYWPSSGGVNCKTRSLLWS